MVGCGTIKVSDTSNDDEFGGYVMDDGADREDADADSDADTDSDADADSDTDADSDADADADADGGSDDCSDYRTDYPSGPYGFGVGDVIEDLPGMVDGSGATMSLLDVFHDRTKMALVISNAFDT
jgi:hypothetical protein